RLKFKKKSTTSSGCSSVVDTGSVKSNSGIVSGTINEIELSEMQQTSGNNNETDNTKQHYDHHQQINLMDCCPSMTNVVVYPECRHCNLLSKNANNNNIINNLQNINPLSNVAAANTAAAILRRSSANSLKYGLLYEHNVYIENLMRLLKDLGQAV